MSIFPTTIVLATDGSEEATLAAETAVVSQKTASELHVVHVRNTPNNFDDFFIGSLSIKKICKGSMYKLKSY